MLPAMEAYSPPTISSAKNQILWSHLKTRRLSTPETKSTCYITFQILNFQKTLENIRKPLKPLTNKNETGFSRVV